MALRTGLQHLAMKMHILGSSPAPLPENAMEMAIYLHLGVSLVMAGLLFTHGVPLAGCLGAVVAVFFALTLALYHRWARWLSIAGGGVFAIALGCGVGYLVGTASAIAIGTAVGGLCAVIAYGRFIAELRAAKTPR